MMTNAQVALQAAATSLSGAWKDAENTLLRAQKYKAWLDQQDEADRQKARAGDLRTYGEV